MIAATVAAAALWLALAFALPYGLNALAARHHRRGGRDLRWAGWFGGILLMVPVTALLFLYPAAIFGHSRRVDGAAFAGDRLAVVYRTGATGRGTNTTTTSNFALIDLRDGRRILRERGSPLLGDPWRLLGSDGATAWLLGEDGVVGRDLATGAVRTTEAELRARAPALAGGVAPGRLYATVDASSGDLCLESRERVVVRFDRGGGARALAPTEPPCSAPDPPSPTAHDARFGERAVSFVGEPRRKLRVEQHHRGGAVGDASWIAPSLLVDAAGGRPILLDGSVLVLAGDEGAPPELTRVSLDGAVAWRATVADEAGASLHAAHLDGGTLYLLFYDAVVALDAATGAPRWRLPL